MSFRFPPPHFLAVARELSKVSPFSQREPSDLGYTVGVTQTCTDVHKYAHRALWFPFYTVIYALYTRLEHPYIFLYLYLFLPKRGPMPESVIWGISEKQNKIFAFMKFTFSWGRSVKDNICQI